MHAGHGGVHPGGRIHQLGSLVAIQDVQIGSRRNVLKSRVCLCFLYSCFDNFHFDSLREHFGSKLFDTTIRASIAYAESAERAQSILDYRPDLAADYLAVSEELLKRLGMDGPRRRVAALSNAAGVS